MAVSLRKLRCGYKYRKRLEDIAEVDLFGDPAKAGEMYFSTLRDLMECAGVEYGNGILAAEQYERWRSFWQFVVATKRIEDRRVAQHLLSDLAESFSMPRAKELGITEDYGEAKTKLLHNLATGALVALEAGNVKLAESLARRGADVQYWIALMRLEKPPRLQLSLRSKPGLRVGKKLRRPARSSIRVKRILELNGVQIAEEIC